MSKNKWERREKKQKSKKKKMPVHGRGLLTVIAPIVKDKAEKAKQERENGN